VTTGQTTPKTRTSATAGLTDPEQMLEAAAHLGDEYLSQLEAVRGQAAVLASFLRAMGAPQHTIDAVLMGDRATWFAWVTEQYQAGAASC